MNCRDAYAESTVHGYIGWVRLDWKAEPFEVRVDNKDGPVAYFRNATEAELAAWRLKHKIELKAMTRDGDTLSTGVRAAAEALFCKQRGREKRIVVERRSARA